MGRLGSLLKYLILLALLGGIGVAGYALLSELPAPTRDVTAPLPLPGEEQ
jgi:hypothetical protein